MSRHLRWTINRCVVLLVLSLCVTQFWAGEAGTTPPDPAPPATAGETQTPPVPPTPNPTASEAGTTPVAAVAPKDYTLYPGDLVKIEVFDHPDLTTTIRIPANGLVPFPLIGDVKEVVGRSVDQFTSELSTRLLDGYIKQAVITATVIEFSPRFVYVMGHVAKPSGIPMNPFIQLTAMQAIGEAGGFLEDANRAGAQVIRDDPKHPGGKVGLAVPNTDKADSLVSDVVLKPNDIIIVPRLDRVYVIGQVGKPGAVNLPSHEKLTVSKAISLTGGFAQFAKQGDVQLMRTGKPSQVIDVRAILTGNSKIEDPVLEPGDTVFVPESRF